MRTELDKELNLHHFEEMSLIYDGDSISRSFDSKLWDDILMNQIISEDENPCSRLFSLEEISNVRRRGKKDVGSVGIKGNMIRELEHEIGIDRGLYILFNTYFSLGIMSNSWKLAGIFLLFINLRRFDRTLLVIVVFP